MKKLAKIRFKEGGKVDCFLSRQLTSTYFSYQEIFAMLVPLILDQFFISVIGLLTTAMISSSSQESVSAVSLVTPLYMMIYAVYSAISSAGTVIIAQYKGHGDRDKMKRAAGQIVMFTFVTAVVFSAILILAAEPLISIMFAGADNLIIKKSTDYLIGCAISFIFLSIYMGGFAVFRGIGETKICLRLSMIINLIHLFASFLFINILKLDIIGTALSLNLARCVGGGMAMYYLLYPKSRLRVQWKDIVMVNGEILKSIVRTSLPFAMEQICFNGGGILVSMFIVKLGTDSVAANAVCNSTLMVFYSMGMAVSNLAVTIVGQCIGAGDKDMARFYGKRMVWMGEASILLSLVGMLPFLKQILRLYQAPVNTLGQIYILLAIAFVPLALFWSTSNVLPNVLRAAGDVNFASYVSLVTMWLIRVGLSYVVSIRLKVGIEGVWICMGMEWLIRSVIFVLRFRSDRWLLHTRLFQKPD